MLRRTTSVQWLTRSFGTHTQTLLLYYKDGLATRLKESGQNLMQFFILIALLNTE